jgi:hypothetical protein
LNAGIRDRLANFGISGVSPSEVLRHYTDVARAARIKRLIRIFLCYNS